MMRPPHHAVVTEPPAHVAVTSEGRARPAPPTQFVRCTAKARARHREWQAGAGLRGPNLTVIRGRRAWRTPLVGHADHH